MILLQISNKKTFLLIAAEGRKNTSKIVAVLYSYFYQNDSSDTAFESIKKTAVYQTKLILHFAQRRRFYPRNNYNKQRHTSTK